jgi:hypothetical protein
LLLEKAESDQRHDQEIHTASGTSGLKTGTSGLKSSTRLHIPSSGIYPGTIWISLTLPVSSRYPLSHTGNVDKTKKVLTALFSPIEDS